MLYDDPEVVWRWNAKDLVGRTDTPRHLHSYGKVMEDRAASDGGAVMLSALLQIEGGRRAGEGVR